MANVFQTIKRSETQSGDRMTGSFHETKSMELLTGDAGIHTLIHQSGFKDSVDDLRIFVFDGAVETRVLFENCIIIRLKDTHGGDCMLCSETSGKIVTKNWTYWLPGVESEFRYYKCCRNVVAQGCFAVQKEFKHTTFLDTILVTYYKVVDKVGTFVFTFKVKTNGGATLSLEEEEPALYPCDYGPQKIQYFLNQSTSANIEPGDLFSRCPSSGRKSLLPNVALSSNSNSGNQISKDVSEKRDYNANHSNHVGSCVIS